LHKYLKLQEFNKGTSKDKTGKNKYVARYNPDGDIEVEGYLHNNTEVS
jgi:hypothetical protein